MSSNNTSSTTTTVVRMPSLPTEPLPINAVSRGMLYIYTCTQCDFKTHIEALFKQHVDSIHLGLGTNNILLGGNLSAIATLPSSSVLGQPQTLLMAAGSDEATIVQSQQMDQRVIILTSQGAQQLQQQQLLIQEPSPVTTIAATPAKAKRSTSSSASAAPKTPGGSATAANPGSGKKTYSCTSCDYSTTRRDGLAQHYDSVHLKIKGHQCELCPYAASQKGTLNRHIKLRHKKDSYANKGMLVDVLSSAKDEDDS